MSKENVDLVREAIAVLNEGNIAEMETNVARFYHPDIVQHDLQPAPGTPAEIQGIPAVLAVWRQWLEVLDKWTVEVHEYIDADPWVVCDTHWRAVGKGSDMAIDWRVADAHEIRDGKIVRELFGFADVESALEAVERIRTESAA